MSTEHIHVIGAGLAGLAAATAAVEAGARVTLHERSPLAGGRCRSFHDASLGRTIDNGNHLILSGNRATLAYAARIGAADRLVELAPAAIPFVDVRTGERWALRPGPGRSPLWLADPTRRPGGVSAVALLKGALRLLLGAMPDGRGPATTARAFERFWVPLVTSVMNTSPDEADPTLMRRVLLETVGRGEAQCRPVLTREGLGHALVEPALDHLARHGAKVRLAAGIDAVRSEQGRATALRSGERTHTLGPDAAVVLATPPWITTGLIPGLDAPWAYSPIVNAHFAVEGGGDTPGFVGLVGGTAEWVFRRRGLASVTVSAARHLVERPAAEIAAVLWADVARALDLAPEPLPAHRIVKEKRATPVQTRHAARRRWAQRTALSNLVLAGDWVATGLPATIEGAVRSGERAASLALEGR